MNVKKCVTMLIGAGFLMTGLAAADPIAVLMPHATVDHLDPDPELMEPGELVMYIFSDSLFAPTEYWHWETELHNQNAFEFTELVTWELYGHVVKSAFVTLGPGESLYTHMLVSDDVEVGGPCFRSQANYSDIDVTMHQTISEDPDGTNACLGDVIMNILLPPGTPPETPPVGHIDPPGEGPSDIVFSVPEPGTLGLLALGVLTMIRRRRCA